MLTHRSLIHIQIAGFFLLFFFFALPLDLLAQQVPARPEETQVAVKRFTGVDVLGDREICEGSQTTLQVDGEYESYSWSTGSTERSITVKKAGIYEVTVKTKGGCTFTTGVNVRTKPCT